MYGENLEDCIFKKGAFDGERHRGEPHHYGCEDKPGEKPSKKELPAAAYPALLSVVALHANLSCVNKVGTRLSMCHSLAMNLMNRLLHIAVFCKIFPVV